MSADLQGRALWDFYTRGKDMLKMHTSYAPKHNMPLAAFFTDPEDKDVEKAALENCRGHILDIGAGAGRFSLALQKRGHIVSALEISPLCCQVMRKRGVQTVFQESFWDHQGYYDTLLLMMNGIGLAGTLSGVQLFLAKLKSLLKPGGQVLLDSSDLNYLYDSDFPKPTDKYFGEVEYCYEYRGTRAKPFNWLFLDWEALQKEAKKAGLAARLLKGPIENLFLVQLEVSS